MNDKTVIMYLINRKISTNRELIKLYGDKSEYPDFPIEKILAQNNKMRRIRKAFVFSKGFVTFDDAVKSIVNDSIDDSFYKKYE